MIQIQLRPRGSHRHIVPVVILYLLVIAFGDIGGMNGQRNWLAEAGGVSAAVVMGIMAFYAVIPFLYMAMLKESWLGTNLFGFSVPAKALRRAIVGLGLCLTYFGFVCRVALGAGSGLRHTLVRGCDRHHPELRQSAVMDAQYTPSAPCFYRRRPHMGRATKPWHGWTSNRRGPKGRLAMSADFQNLSRRGQNSNYPRTGRAWILREIVGPPRPTASAPWQRLPVS